MKKAENEKKDLTQEMTMEEIIAWNNSIDELPKDLSLPWKLSYWLGWQQGKLRQHVNHYQNNIRDEKIIAYERSMQLAKDAEERKEIQKNSGAILGMLDGFRDEKRVVSIRVPDEKLLEEAGKLPKGFATVLSFLPIGD